MNWLAAVGTATKSTISWSIANVLIGQDRRVLNGCGHHKNLYCQLPFKISGIASAPTQWHCVKETQAGNASVEPNTGPQIRFSFFPDSFIQSTCNQVLCSITPSTWYLKHSTTHEWRFQSYYNDLFFPHQYGKCSRQTNSIQINKTGVL